MKESQIRKIIREELLREQEEREFTYNDGCVVMQLTGSEVKLEWSLVGSVDSYVNWRGEWPSLFHAQKGPQLANELQRAQDGAFMGCTISGRSNPDNPTYDVDVVEFRKDRNRVFRAEGRDAKRFYDKVLGAPFDLNDRFVLDTLERGY